MDGCEFICELKKEMLYFAYGHNADDDEMHKRLPNALKIGKGVVRNYVFKLYRFANIEKGSGQVEGVVWKLSPAEMRVLDGFENVPVDYRRWWRWKWGV